MVRAYELLLQHLIEHTDYMILLIPHVDWSYPGSDTKTLKRFYKQYAETGRIILCEIHTAPKQKYIMSRCKYMAALRTHASISAISAGAPTILTGYKSKTTGIANDLYKDFPQMLVHIDAIHTGREILESFLWLEKNEKQVRDSMRRNMKQYIKQTELIKEKLYEL